HSRRAVIPRGRRAGCGRRTDRQDRAAGRDQLAVAPAVGGDGHHRRTKRRAVAAEPGRGRLGIDRRASRPTRRDQPRHAGVSLLAPARFCRAQPSTGTTEMTIDPHRPERLTRVNTEAEAAGIVTALTAHGIQATATGGFTAGFRAEAPGYVNVLVRHEDLAAAKQVLADLKDDGSDIDWSQVDVGQPE